MSFPTITLGDHCPTCKETTSACSCATGPVSQNTVPLQSLPKPTTPLNAEDVPAHRFSSDEVYWAGAANEVLGIQPGDSLTKVINILIAQLP